MPNDYRFPISFRRRYNPDEQRVFARERQWCERYELSEEEAHQVLAAHPGRITAYSLPDASPAGLDLMTDVNCWFWYVDNLFDGPPFDRPAAAARLVEQMAEVVVGQRSPDLSATVTRALAAHWHKACEGMSWHWQARAAHNWATYLWANVTEVADRAGDTGPTTLEAYMSVRRYSIGVAPSLDLIEPTCGFEMPDSAYYRPEIRWLRTLAADVIP